MNNITRWSFLLACAAALGLAPISAVQAQETLQYQQVISANPLGLLFEFFNAEYERVLTPYSTAGVGGSFFSADGEDEFDDGNDTYVNADAFWRYYPQGYALDGFAFGVKAGLTRVNGSTFPGAGFDANYSWLLGKKRNFYVGVGIGAKRLFGADDELLEYVPTIRLVNIGFAF